MAGLWQQVAIRLSGGPVEARANPAYGSMAAAVPSGRGAVYVSEESSLQNAAVLACVRILSGTLAGLPLHVYRRVGEGKERADNTPLARTLAEPNSYQTSYKWRETSWQWALLYGNAVSKIVRNGRGDPVGLKPMEPWHVTFLDQADNPDLVYRYWNPSTRQNENYGAWEVLHLRGLTSDGRIGFSVIENLMYQSVGLALTLQEMATNFY
jgi:HK97 family phage portal protein